LIGFVVSVFVYIVFSLIPEE